MTSQFMPAEWQNHSTTLMAWPGRKSHDYWPLGDISAIAHEVSQAAKAISQFEPVTILVARSQAIQAEQMLHDFGKHGIKIQTVDVDDIKPWMRDIAPTFVFSRGESRTAVHGVDFHFNGWGAKDKSENNRHLAGQIVDRLQIPSLPASIVAEGGAIDVDGEGTLLATESSLVNPNRNLGMDRDAVEKELRRVLGVSTVIWLPGVSGADTTDCHIDALARFAGPGVVTLSRPSSSRGNVWSKVYSEAKQILQAARDAHGRVLRVVDIDEPDIASIDDADSEMIPSYVNYFHTAEAVIVPRFGCHESDAAALETIRALFPGKECVTVYLHALPNAGGGLHCITQQIPSLD